MLTANGPGWIFRDIDDLFVFSILLSLVKVQFYLTKYNLPVSLDSFNTYWHPIKKVCYG